MNWNAAKVVCPRCGADASARPLACGACGLDLSSQYALPTRDEWLARQDAMLRSPAPPTAATTEPHTSAPPPTGGSAPPPGPAPAPPAAPDTVPGALWSSPDYPAQGRPAPAPYSTTPPQTGFPQFSAAGSSPAVPRQARRSTRDYLIAMAAFAIAGGAVLGMVAGTLVFLDALNTQEPGGVDASAALNLFGAIIEIPAVAFLWLAFLDTGAHRRAWLRWLAWGFVIVFTAQTAGGIAVSATYFAKHVPSTGGVGQVLQTIAFAFGIVAALMVDRAFALPDTELIKRSRRLGAGTVILVGLCVFETAAAICTAVFYGNLFAPGSTVTGYDLLAAGYGVLAVAAVVASFGFLNARDWTTYLRRELLLSVAAGIAAVNYLLQTIASFTTISGATDGKAKAAAWFTSFETLIMLGALTCAAVAFAISRVRLAQHR